MSTTKDAEITDKDIKESCKHLQNANSLEILVVGKTGTGKSTLVSGLLGFQADAASIQLKPSTENDKDEFIDSDVKDASTQLKPGTEKDKDGPVGPIADADLPLLKPRTERTKGYSHHVNGVQLYVWDTPGLQDGTGRQDDYLRQINQVCSNAQLILYCIKCGGETRFVDDNPDIKAMKEFTERFGENIWNKTVIVLTFANTISTRKWAQLSEDAKKKKFQLIIQAWQEEIRGVLNNQLNVSHAVPIVPAGDDEEQHLPEEDCRVIQYWLSALLHVCVTVCSTEAKAALLKVVGPRITCEPSGKNSILFPVLVGAGGAVVGGAIGGGIGVAAVKGGLAGLAIGGLVGAGLGAGIGVLVVLALAAFMKQENDEDQPDKKVSDKGKEKKVSDKGKEKKVSDKGKEKKGKDKGKEKKGKDKGKEKTE